MSRKRQGELPQIPGSKNNNKKQKGNNDEDEPASDAGIPRSNNEDESTSDSDISSEKESDLMNKGKDIHLENEIRVHTFEDVDGCIEFQTIPIYRYKKAKKVQKIKITKLESELLDESTPDGDKETVEEKLREARKGLAEVKELVQDLKAKNDDFMFLSKSSNFSLNQKLKERFERVILYSGCAFLPSPEVCKSENHEGSDKTGTLLDFQKVFKWAESHKICEKEKCFEIGNEMVDEQSYNDLIKFAFYTGYEVIRDPLIPTRNELMFYYYAGHGVDKKKVAKRYSAAPVFEQNHVFQESYFNDASPYIRKNREVKGGELFLHKFGFCDFEGLVEPFIAAIKSESIHSSGEKKNKHLIIVLDSCHSGQFAEDLTKFKDQQGPGWLNEGCSVTVQASCKKDEMSVGGYFTPTFMFLNDSENESILKTLLADWDKMKEFEKRKWGKIKLPFSSPVVSSTRNLPDSPILQVWVLIEDKDFHITLFQDPGFFKYCHCEIFGPLKLEKTPYLGNSRVLTETTASEFLKKRKFTVKDFKLKSVRGRKKFGLFLLEDHDAENRSICAHVHFLRGGTSKVGRINLVHHRYDPSSLPRFDYEDDIGLSAWKFDKNKRKIPVAMVPNCENADLSNPNHWVAWRWEKPESYPSFFDLAKAELRSGFRVSEDMQWEVSYAMELLTECHQFVGKVLWSDPKEWNRTKEDYSFLGYFREKQRSLFMEEYYKQIEGYNLPVVQ